MKTARVESLEQFTVLAHRGGRFVAEGGSRRPTHYPWRLWGWNRLRGLIRKGKLLVVEG